jgi:hypothetical protein
VLVTDWDRVEPICVIVVARFDREVGVFYSAEDLARGGFAAKDRQGRGLFVPIMALSLAVVTVSAGEFEHPAQISQTAADIKQFLKRQGASGSAYLVNRRGESRPGGPSFAGRTHEEGDPPE